MTADSPVKPQPKSSGATQRRGFATAARQLTLPDALLSSTQPKEQDGKQTRQQQPQPQPQEEDGDSESLSLSRRGRAGRNSHSAASRGAEQESRLREDQDETEAALPFRSSLSSSLSPSSPPAPRGRKRKAAAVSASSSAALEPDAVLREVREQMRRMQQQPAAASSSSLSSLQLSNVKREVLLMDEDSVRLQVEKLVLEAVRSIESGDGFSFDVPVRSSVNQLFVPELNRIVLKDRTSRRDFASHKLSRKAAVTTRVLSLVYELCLKRIHVTKRDLFYTDVRLFSRQEESDDVLDDCAAMMGCTRTSLNVVASEKGVVVGQLGFFDSGDWIDCTRMGVGGKAIPPFIDRVTGMAGSAQFVLLVEKDAAFMRLAEDRFYLTFPCVIITAKGQPDVATRLFLKKLKQTLRIPILGLVDSDPYGLKILSVYASGSKNMSYDSASLTTADIHWLGVRPSDLDRYRIPAQCRLDMSERDVETGRQMLEEEFISRHPSWLRELQLMVERREKAEIQALSNFGFQFLTQQYLPRKLHDARFDLPDPFMPDPPARHSAAARALRREAGWAEEAA